MSLPLSRRAVTLALLASSVVVPARAADPTTLLNVSYDVAREFYKDFNTVFLAHWKKTGGGALDIKQSHGGSSSQVRSVSEGLEADVVTMNQALDIDFLADRGLVAADWAKRYPNGAAPSASLTVILVRKGNPKSIRDWSDLGKPGVSVVIPNPKVTGNGRYTYLAAWGASIKGGAGPDATKALVGRIFANVPVLDGGGRAATTTFAQRNIGDALATFESEVPLILREFGNNFEVVYPSRTVLAENPVAIVEKVVDRRGSRKLADAYLQFLYTEAGQEVIAKHHLRPRDPKVLARYAKEFPKVETFTVDEVFGGWKAAQKAHFADGGMYDQIVSATKR
jgi:sulfate transport system substrate-binding protein